MKGQAISYHQIELDWIEARKTEPRAGTHAKFCALFGREDVSLGAFNALCERKGWKTGRTGCFTKGHQTHNKGVAMPERVRAKCIATAFKLGNVPHNYRGAGAEFVCPKDGYTYLIISDDQARTKTKTRRVLKHKWLWEQANGPLPKDHALKSVDGDRANCDPGNWVAIPRGMLPRLAGAKVGINYDSAPDELKPVVMAIARLDHEARAAASEQKQIGGAP